MKKLIKISSVFLAMLALTAQAPPSDGEPSFTSIRIADANSVVLTLAGAATTTYSIQATSELGNTNMPFTAIGVVVTDENGQGTFTDVGAVTLHGQRFYRAQKTL